MRFRFRERKPTNEWKLKRVSTPTGKPEIPFEQLLWRQYEFIVIELVVQHAFASLHNNQIYFDSG